MPTPSQVITDEKSSNRNEQVSNALLDQSIDSLHTIMEGIEIAKSRVSSYDRRRSSFIGDLSKLSKIKSCALSNPEVEILLQQMKFWLKKRVRKELNRIDEEEVSGI